jgi:hypothetical protein
MATPQRIVFRRTVTSRFRLLFLLALTLLPVAAQKLPSPLSPLSLEDPELYFAFFRAHAALASKIREAQPAVAAQLASQTAALYLISDGDLARVTGEVDKFTASLAAWQVQEQKYVAQARESHQPLDMTTMIQFQYQRQRLVMTTHDSIHSAISEASWVGLHNYVNGAFKARVKQ